MPDAIDVLVNDHRTVDQLFEQVQGTDQPDQDAVHRIVRELSVHDAIERAHVYPRLRHNVDDGDSLAERSEQEHTEVATTLVAIDDAQAGSAEQRKQLQKLIELVRHHVQEEEKELFPALRQRLGGDELDKLGEILESAKKTAPTRPHPGAPDEGMAHKVAGAMTAPLDKVRDAAEGR
jgi:hemerythrin superfamily protein